MLRNILLFFMALAAPAAAVAQAPAPTTSVWRRDNDRVTLVTPAISFPAQAGTARLTEAREFSHPGEGLDNVVQYASADRSVLATAYVYYPGLPHVGLSAYATDRAIRQRSGEALRFLGTQVTRAGGHEDVAVRNDYSGFAGSMASSAAFVRAGRWIVKLRVSGPENKRDEVMSAMTALLEGIRFEGEVLPTAAAPLQISPCASASDTPARLLPDDMAQTAENAIVIPFARTPESGDEGTGEAFPLALRFDDRWCTWTLARIGNSEVAILRAAGLPENPADRVGRSRLIAPLTDAGGTLEVVETREGRFVTLHHQIGETRVLGTFDALPSDEQIVAIIAGSDPEASRIRASVEFRANGDQEVTIIAPEAKQSAPTT
jgi:hypothetical protein